MSEIELEERMGRSQDFILRLPVMLRNIREFVEIGDADDKEIDRTWLDVNVAEQNQYIPSATFIGIERWEKILGIIPKPYDSIEDRRFRISICIAPTLPYTYKNLHRLLTIVCGETGYVIERDTVLKTLFIKLALGNKSMLATMRSVLEEFVPMNMSLTVDLLYNTHEMLSDYTHEGLSDSTHEALRSEVLES